MDKQLQQVIDAVRAASPYVWQAAYHYVIVDAVTGILSGLFCFGLAGWLFTLTKKFDDEIGVFFAYLGVVIALIAGAAFVLTSTEQLVAASYFAIKAIPGLVR